MQPIPFFLILSSLLFFSSLSQADVGAVVSDHSQSLENQMAVSTNSGEEYLAFKATQSMEELLLFL